MKFVYCVGHCVIDVFKVDLVPHIGEYSREVGEPNRWNALFSMKYLSPNFGHGFLDFCVSLNI